MKTDVPVRRPLEKALSLAALMLLLTACAAPAASGSLQENPSQATSRSPARAVASGEMTPAGTGPASASEAQASGNRLATLQPESEAPLQTDGAAEDIVTMSFTGLASWYGKRFHGLRTASGERFDMTALTAAHPSLPFGSRVRITNLGNDRSVIVIINDRGPFVKTRLIDVSHAAAKKLGILEDGVAEVRVDVLADAAS